MAMKVRLMRPHLIILDIGLRDQGGQDVLQQLLTEVSGIASSVDSNPPRAVT